MRKRKIASNIEPLDRLRAFAGQYRTQQEAATALGVSQVFLSDMLRGRRSVSENVMAKLGLRWTVIEAGKAS